MGGKILGIGGSMKRDNSSSAYLLSVALEAARGYPGVETEQIRLADYPILKCTGCGECMAGRHCPLLDDPNDHYRELYEKLYEADGFIFSSPVYALSLPAIWRIWLERCEPCHDDDLDFEFYNYDRAVGVKGKALRGKVAGQIAVAAGPGHELAMASMIPAFTCARLSMVASAGISLIEYDGQPSVQAKPWSKPVQDAAFAIEMARGVGKRVGSALDFSYFDSPRAKRGPSSIDLLRVEDPQGKRATLKSFSKGQPFLAVGTDRDSLPEAYKLLHTECPNGTRRVMIASVGPLPPGMDKEEIRGKLRADPGVEVLIDWKGALAGFTGRFPVTVAASPAGGWSIREKKGAGMPITGGGERGTGR